MVWGTFGVPHLVTLVAAALILLGLYFLLRKLPEKAGQTLLGVLSFSGIAAIIYNLLAWDAPLFYLPLHLCSLNAMVLPVAVFTRNKTLNNLLLVWSLGALVALILNYDMAHVELNSWAFVFYYFPHVLEFGIPVLMFVMGWAKKDPKCIVPTVSITMCAYTLIHFANLAINEHLANIGAKNRVNYMFSLGPNNPLTELFYKLIPYDYWFMYLVIPILVVYLLAVYAPQFLKKK